MTDQNKPRPKVTSHITSTPSHPPSTTYKASIRAKVTPGAITASQTPPGASSKPSLKSTPSSSSLRSHASASSAGTPRTGARSPLQRTPSTPSTPAPVPQARVTKPFQAQRSPLTPGFAPSSGHPSSSSSSVSASGVASGTPVAVPRVRAAKSALGVSSLSNSSASKRKNNTESSTGSRSHSRSGNDDGSEYEQTPDAQARRYAVDKATSTVGTNGRIDRAPRARVKLQPQPQTQAQTGLQNQGTHLPPHVPYHLLTHPTASAPASPIHYSQLQDHNPDIQAQDQDPNLPSALPSTSTSTSFTMTRRTSKPRLPPMVLHPYERQQALKEGRKIVGAASVGSGMRIMPGSPEMKTVELPALTPRVPGTPVLAGQGNGEWKDDEKNGYGNRENGTEQEEVTNKTGGEGEGIKRDRVENEVEVEAGTEEKGNEEQEVDDMLGTDAVEAKINRKIADLEISNASLLAINQALEATKSKQRAEIGKLRRRLRETLAFPHLGAGGASGGSPSSFGRGFGAGFSGSHSNSGLDLGASTLEDEPERENDFDLFLLHEAEMADPQLDARWCKMEDLVLGMKKAAEEAVRKGEEEGSREGRGRVLGWAEMEEMRDMGDGDASFTSEGNGEKSEEEEGTVS
ncbi:Hypothetical protein CGB_E0320W [Cryptococcus gattii WM276]|uniref:Uncharacterized protein n=1 Tax=Cryptococcus gattii serotype B (strain WM276 / ATCC MYA-4071) TaxID=367775 RepID=E6R6D4_CRYGW|nr:Hypothetical protein CGB_E0320W [Cryptococcus gattii WM276]ADV22270.1 Hypothetical protein CGB_E0320W [Cryptococcus gattii WM276]KJE04806.1 hypothetical protein I311_01253 [Cryptococcus gattii NT-10]